MTLRTGTSRSGRVHRYYTCSTCARAGKTACMGRSIRMDRLDTLVTNQLVDRLLTPERLPSLLEGLAARRAARSTEVNTRIQELEARAAEADERLRRLYTLVETGHAEMDELLKARISALQADRETIWAAVRRARGTRSPQVVMDQARLEAFSRLIRERLTTGEIPFRKAYLGAIIDRVEVDDNVIRIVGQRDVLERAIVGNEKQLVPGVRSFVRKWRTRQDSNLRPLDSESNTLSS
jgi:site-specific DNA recombinase